MGRSSHELLIPDHDFAFATISDVEEPLDRALLEAGVGEVTGGGIGSGWYLLEMELSRPEEALAVVREVAAWLELPATALLREIRSQKTIAVR